MGEQKENGTRRSGLGRLARASAIAIVALGAVGAAGMVAARGMGFSGPFGGPFGGAGIERMLDAADANDAQAAEIRTIIEAARGDILPLVGALPEHRTELMALLGAETLDRAAFEALRQQMLDTADEVSARALAGFLDAAEVLTPEQRATLLAERGSRMERGMGPWHGPRGGWGQRGEHRGDHWGDHWGGHWGGHDRPEPQRR